MLKLFYNTFLSIHSHHQTTTNMKKSQKIANYIINMVKSVGKDKNYALSIVEWYTFTEKQDQEVKSIIENKF